MIITVASFKGGVGKTTAAVHLGCYFNQIAPTLLVDGDPNRSATGWAARGSIPFNVVDERRAVKEVSSGSYNHIIFDTQARPKPDDLEELARGCDLLVLPTTVEAMALEALASTVGELKSFGDVNFKVLLNIVPSVSKYEPLVRKELGGLPVFKTRVRRYNAFLQASLSGIPVYEVKGDPRALKGWKDYQDVGKEILK